MSSAASPLRPASPSVPRRGVRVGAAAQRSRRRPAARLRPFHGRAHRVGRTRRDADARGRDDANRPGVARRRAVLDGLERRRPLPRHSRCRSSGEGPPERLQLTRRAVRALARTALSGSFDGRPPVEQSCGGVNVDRYLARIGYAGSREPSLATLTGLQAAHLFAVPFENLHVFHRVGVRVDIDWSYDKIVEQRRGGWCYELNGCFAELLARLGFDVDRLSCRTFDAATGGLSADFDHLALLVRVDGAPTSWTSAGATTRSPRFRPSPASTPAGPGPLALRFQRTRGATDRTQRTYGWRPECGSCSTGRRAGPGSSPSSPPAAATCRPSPGSRGPRSRSSHAGDVRPMAARVTLPPRSAPRARGRPHDPRHTRSRRGNGSTSCATWFGMSVPTT